MTPGIRGANQLWVVRCDNYVMPRRFVARDAAERAIVQLEKMGACALEHQAVPITLDEHDVWRLPDGTQAP